jgi:hypothetical protein
MTQTHQVAILIPLVVGGGAVLCTIFIHALALMSAVNFFRYERKVWPYGHKLLSDLAIVSPVLSFAFVAHLLEIALWHAHSSSADNSTSSE